MKRRISARFGQFAAFVLLLGSAWSCSPVGSENSTVAGAVSGSSATAASGGAGPGTGPGPGSAGTSALNLGGNISTGETTGPCMGLECKVPTTCAAGADTTISGKVYAPNGTLPLYNVVVYIPNATVEPLTQGASCDRCGANIANPVTAAVTDESGAFVLHGAPADANVPVVIQVGKWRRQVTLPSVAPCVDTPMAPELSRLPRNKLEGDLPLIAISAGGADAMECLPRKLGIDDAEFTTSTGTGRVHLFTATDNGGANGGDLSIKAFAPTLNAGAMLPHSMQLWADVPTLKKYDIVMLSCEGTRFIDEKPPVARQALYDYASQGGRVFASHWAHVWFSDGPAPVPTTGTWMSRTNPAEAASSLPATINQTFPKGEALAKWLVNVNASTTQGTLNVIGPRDDIQTINPNVSREWITLDNPNFPQAPKVVEYLSFHAPIGVPEAEACGRAVFTGLHVSNNVEDRLVQPPGFPLECDAMELTAQEKAVAFMLFDLSSCIQNDDEPPKPPK